jgi:hypothetical protein
MHLGGAGVSVAYFVVLGGWTVGEGLLTWNCGSEQCGDFVGEVVRRNVDVVDVVLFVVTEVACRRQR